MSKRTRANRALPAKVAEGLERLGHDLAVARKRRQISMRDMADRMMVSVDTVQRLEKGDPGVGLGVFGTALWVLGLDRRLPDLVVPESDPVGQQYSLENLPQRVRRPKEDGSSFDF